MSPEAHGGVGISSLPVMIVTSRMRLRPWRESDRVQFALLHADPDVMWDCGETLDRQESDAKFDRYSAIYEAVGFGRWAVETHEDRFLGYVGVMPSRPGHPLGPHAEIGWRLTRSTWGNGYATEGAKAALRDAFDRCGLTEVLAYTAPDNLRSQAVMNRLGLRRDPSRDHSEPTSRGLWHGMVWVATP